RNRNPLSGASCRKRPRRGCHLCQPDRAAMRARHRALLRHGWHDREDLPDRRFSAADQPRFRGRAHLPLQKGQRPAIAHPGHRDGRDRGWGRLDRPHRPAEAHHRRPRQRRRRSGPRLLRPRRQGAFDAASANALLGAMRAEAEAIVRRGEPKAPLTETRSAFMRYRGQGHEIAVPVPARDYRDEDAGELLAAFETAYRRLYSRIIPGVEVEVLSWVLLLSGPVPADPAEPPPEPPRYTPQPARRRAVFDADTADFIDVPIYERAALVPGAVIAGPAVIVEDETSTLVSPAFDARIDAYGYIELTRRTASQ